MVRIVLPLILLFSLIIAYLIYSFESNLNLLLKIDHERQVKHIDEVIQGFELNSEVTFVNTIMVPEVLQILQQAQQADMQQLKQLNSQLFKLLQPQYENLKRISQVRQLHFHLPDGRSFLRMHRPNKFGDSLFDFRYSVKLANQQKKFVKGFEEGRIFNGYRFVYPIDSQGQHLGSVEISVSMSAIIDSLNQIYGSQHCFMLDGEVMIKKVFQDETGNYLLSPYGKDFVLDKGIKNDLCSIGNPHIKSLTEHQDIKSKLKQRKYFSEVIGSKWLPGFQGYVAHYTPFKNVEGEPIAYLYNIKKNAEIVSLQNRFIYNLVIALLLFSVLLAIAILVHKRQKELERQKIALEKAVQERTQKYDLLLEDKNYIQNIMQIIFSVIDHLNRIGKIDKLLYESCENLMRTPHYDFVTIRTYHQELNVPLSQAAIKDGLKAGDLEAFFSLLEQDHSIELLLKHGELASLETRLLYKHAHHILAFLNKRKIEHLVLIPLFSKDQHTYGFIAVFCSQEASFEERMLLKKLGVTISQAIYSLQRREGFEANLQTKITDYKKLAFDMVDMLEKRLPINAGHSVRVSKYARKIAMEMGLDKAAILEIGEAAMFQNLAMHKLPSELILKPHHLDPKTAHILQHAPVESAKLFEGFHFLKTIKETILHTKEKVDGSGYPHSLEGENIPLFSRIIAVAEAFDNLTTYQLDHPKLSVDAALQELNNLRNIHFDAKVVEAAGMALSKVHLEEKTLCLPTSGTEFDRICLFFKDSFSDCLNHELLQIILENSLQNASEHNGEHFDLRLMQSIQVEWNTTKNLDEHLHEYQATIRKLGRFLKRLYPKALCFYFHNREFILLHQQALNLSLQQQQLHRVESLEHIHLKIENIEHASTILQHKL